MRPKKMVVDVTVKEQVSGEGCDTVFVALTPAGFVSATATRGTLIHAIPLDKFRRIAAAAERLALKQEAVRRAIEDA